MIRRILGISIVSASLLAMGCSSSDDDADPATTAGETTAGETTAGETTAGGMTYTAPESATGNVLQTVPAELVTALNNAGITELPAGTYTIFSPSAAALATAQEAGGLLDPELTEAERAAVLQFHVANGVYAADPGETGANTVAAGELEMLSGLYATIAGDATNGLTFGGANITGADMFSTDGVVHEIDAVVDPAVAGSTTAGTTTDGTTTDGTTTDGTTTDGTTTDGTTTDGGAGGTACVQTAPVAGTQYEAVTQDAELTSFMAMLQDSALGQFCNNMNDAANGPWTVFAPNNTALGAFTGTATDNTLRAHIYTNGSLEDAAALAAQAATGVGLTNALNGQLAVTESPLTVGTFNVLRSIVANNGTIHVIDGVIGE